MNLQSIVILALVAVGAWLAFRAYRKAGSCSCGTGCKECSGNCSCCKRGEMP